MKRLNLIIIFLLLMALPAQAAVKIGVYLPMTGSAAAMGQMVWEGVQAAHRMQPQILGQPVELDAGGHPQRPHRGRQRRQPPH